MRGEHQITRVLTSYNLKPRSFQENLRNSLKRFPGVVYNWNGSKYSCVGEYDSYCAGVPQFVVTPVAASPFFFVYGAL